jgi:hypothetical protein
MLSKNIKEAEKKLRHDFAVFLKKEHQKKFKVRPC